MGTICRSAEKEALCCCQNIRACGISLQELSKVSCIRRHFLTGHQRYIIRRCQKTQCCQKPIQKLSELKDPEDMDKEDFIKYLGYDVPAVSIAGKEIEETEEEDIKGLIHEGFPVILGLRHGSDLLHFVFALPHAVAQTWLPHFGCTDFEDTFLCLDSAASCSSTPLPVHISQVAWIFQVLHHDETTNDSIERMMDFPSTTTMMRHHFHKEYSLLEGNVLHHDATTR